MYNVSHCVFFFNRQSNKILGFLVRKQKVKFFKRKVDKLSLFHRSKEMQVKKVLHLTHEENIEKTKEVLRKPGTREAITLILDTVKLCASKHFIERSQGQCQK